MKTSYYIYNLMIVLTMLISTQGKAISTQPNEDPVPKTRADYQQIIVAAAAGISWDAEKQSDYLVAVERILAAGAEALPALDLISRDPELSTFERRLAWLVAERIRNPRLFERMEQFLKTLKLPPPPEPRLSADYIGRGSPPLDMLDEKTRNIVLEYPETIELLRKTRAKDEQEHELNESLYSKEPGRRADANFAAHKRLVAIMVEAKIPDAEREIIFSYIYSPCPKLDSQYLPALEEAALRTSDVRRRMAMMHLLFELNDPQSLIVLSELGRRAASIGDHIFDRSSLSSISIYWHLGQLFQRWPSGVALREVAKTLEFENAHPQARRITRPILGELSRSEEWRAFLDQALKSDDKQSAEDAEKVKQALPTLKK